MDEPDPVVVRFAPLLDVSDLSIDELRGAPALARVVARLLSDLDDPHGVVSAFGSYID